MIRLVLAEDQQLFPGALSALLALHSDLTVIAEVNSGPAALEAAREFRPDILLADIGIPVLNGLAVAEQLRRENAPTRVVLLTPSFRPDELEAARLAQVSGYLFREISARELAISLRQVQAGLTPMMTVTGAGLSNPLNFRQQQVLQLAATGVTTLAIAQALGMKQGTVRGHLSVILRIMQVQNRAEAGRQARARGWI
ncbi:response regulator [Deinococcus aquaticus]|uniref:response regulator n=1 Tax=Deinococcus aquaticus TaxID=328692 RepID=UPI003F449F35